jgi:polygalacturonase
LDTRAIQSAIDQCGASGGGPVLVPPGRYLTGTLRLRDRVTLELEGGAEILGSPRLEDYPVVQDSVRSYTYNYTERCLIRADGVTDCGIRGAGVINGNGAAFAGAYTVRPYLLRFIACKGVRMEGITLRDSAMWVQHYLDCEDVYIDGIRVRSRRNHVNNDGIDIDSCRRVRISNCDIDAGDDAIVLKATAAAPCRDVVVANCILSTLCSAFKLGTESNGGFDNIVLTNTVIHNTRLAAIALETVDGGELSRVSISNVMMRDVGCPIFVRLGNRARPVMDGDPKPGWSTLSGVTIRGVQATSNSKIGCSITGLPGHPVENVLLDDVRIVAPGGGDDAMAAREIPERPEAYPEYSMFGPLPAHGLYCRHVRGLSLNRVSFSTAMADRRPALVADDVDGLRIEDLEGYAPETAAALTKFRNVRRLRIVGADAVKDE